MQKHSLMNLSYFYDFFNSERVAEPGRYGDPRTKAHSSSAKKTVQDGEFLF